MGRRSIRPQRRIGYAGRMQSSLLALVAANLVPLVGAMFFGWDALEVFALYWSENVVIGAFAVLRILTSRTPLAGALFLSAFFTVHFGIFCFVHSVFVLLLAGEDRPDLDPLHAPSELLGKALASAHGVGLYALIASHGVAFVQGLPRSFAERRPFDLFAPYRRVLAMHVLVLVGGMLVVFAGRGPYLLALLAVVKTAADAIALRAEQRRLLATARAPDAVTSAARPSSARRTSP